MAVSKKSVSGKASLLKSAEANISRAKKTARTKTVTRGDSTTGTTRASNAAKEKTAGTRKAPIVQTVKQKNPKSEKNPAPKAGKAAVTQTAKQKSPQREKNPAPKAGKSAASTAKKSAETKNEQEKVTGAKKIPRTKPTEQNNSQAKKIPRTKPAEQNNSQAKKSAGGKAPGEKDGQRRNSKANPNAQALKKLAEAIQAGTERDYTRAVAILEELLSGFDAPPETYLYMGRARHALKNYSLALASFNDYIRLKPEAHEGYLFAGRSYLALGMPHKAVPLFRKSHALKGGDMISAALLGTAYLKARHSRLAVETFQTLVETAAANGAPAKFQTRLYRAYINSLFIRGINLCRADDFDLGSQMLRFALENGADSPLLRLELGRACREMGNMSEALDHYTRALDYNPNDLRIRWYRTSVLMALGNQADALAELDAIRAQDAGLPDLPWNSQLVDLYMIRSFLDSGEWRRAADSCRMWLKQHGPSALIHVMYAEALRNLKNFDAALNHMDRASEIEPENIQHLYERILIAWEGENWKALEKALRLFGKLSGDDDIFTRFSVLLRAKTGDDNKEIIDLLQNAIRGLGPEPELMYALGESYLKEGLIDLALNWFRKTIVVRDNHERSWLGKIAALEALALEENPNSGNSGLVSQAGRRELSRRAGEIADELRDSYDQYVSRWPDNFSLRRERAIYLVHTFHYEEASEELENLLGWEPSNFSLRRVLSYAYRKTGRYREAAVYLKSLLKEKPRDIEILLEYSGCLQRSGAAQYAVSVLEKARDFLKTSTEIPMALGLLYARESKIEKAFDLLREAAALNKNDPRPYKWMALLASRKGDKAGAKRYEREAAKRESQAKSF